jgi:hypothetical protein
MSDAFEGVATYNDRLIILLDAEKALPRPALPSAGTVQEGGLDA